MTFSNQIKKMNDAIYRPSVVYFSPEMFPHLTENRSNSHLIQDIFQKIWFLGKDGRAELLEKTLGVFSLVEKSEILNINYLEILELKHNISSETFAHILVDHQIKITEWMNTYGWMQDNLKKHFYTVKDEIYSLFAFQYHTLKNYQNRIHEQIDGNLINQGPEGKSHFELGIQNKMKSQQKKQSKKSQFKLPEDSVVDAWLLETIFNQKL